MARKIHNQLIAVSCFVAALGFGGIAQAITIAGNTNNSSPIDILSLHYDPASFSLDVPVGPGPTDVSLGTFILNGCTFVPGSPCDDIFNHTFTLKMTFTVPSTVPGSADIEAAISGTIGRSGNSPNIHNGSSLTIDFDNALHHLTYSNGPGGSFGGFDIRINDVDAIGPFSNSSSQFPVERQVNGQILNLTQEFSTSVPEPSTMLLLGSGLLLLGRSLRKKESNS
jgi:hypothetical protein